MQPIHGVTWAARFNRMLSHVWIGRGLFLVALLPFFWLLFGALSDQLGANPAEYLSRSTGSWTLRFLCLVLAVTPLRQLAGLAALARYRRTWGLFTYFYATLHLLSYAWFDMGFYASEIGADILKRPFILVGFLAWTLLTPLAMTSSNRMIKRLGARRWQGLHRAVYLVALLAVLHFFWMRAGKSDFADVFMYGGILSWLLVWRIWRLLVSIAKRRGQPSPS